ncbi:MAG TPA: TldD/PmbA family protein [Nitrososphaera sp.]|jgi:PmbA protein|nr:TldD/PmbA family protein [Nitrososphaera sp.]
MQELVSFAVKQAEAQGADDAEAFAATLSESEVFLENNDVKQAKSQRMGSIGLRVIVDGSPGFYSVNRLTKDSVRDAAVMAVKIARASPPDKFNSFPRKSKVKLLRGIYDKASESFGAEAAARTASEMLDAAKSRDPRITVDSGSFSSARLNHYLSNSNGLSLSERISSFSWSIMGMAIDSGEVSSFDFQSGGTHFVKRIDVRKTAVDFADTVLDSLKPKKIESFRGEMLLAPSAVNELVEEVIAHSVNSDAVQKKSSAFAGKIGMPVASEILTVEDDATNTDGLGAASFDREGTPHRRNVVIVKGVLKKLLYNTYTAKKDGVRTTGNAGGSSSSPPLVSTTNFIIRAGTSSIDKMISEMKKGIIVSRFSGNVNPINGDFSGVVKGGKLVERGTVVNAVKEVMVAGNIFSALKNLDGVSKERKVMLTSILPYLRIGNISFTGG